MKFSNSVNFDCFFSRMSAEQKMLSTFRFTICVNMVQRTRFSQNEDSQTSRQCPLLALPMRSSAMATSDVQPTKRLNRSARRVRNDPTGACVEKTAIDDSSCRGDGRGKRRRAATGAIVKLLIIWYRQRARSIFTPA